MSYEVQVVVLGGLTVDVEFTTYFEPGDCGVRGTCIDEWSIVGINGKTKKNTDWILKRLSGKDEDRITEACYEAIN